jgi:hypothetical protein
LTKGLTTLPITGFAAAPAAPASALPHGFQLSRFALVARPGYRALFGSDKSGGDCSVDRVKNLHGVFGSDYALDRRRELQAHLAYRLLASARSSRRHEERGRETDAALVVSQFEISA